MRTFSAVALWIIAISCLGCEPSHYRAETRLLPDGTIERTILQPLTDSPPAAQYLDSWQLNYHIHRSDVRNVADHPLSKLLLRHQNMDATSDQEFLHAAPRIYSLASPDNLYNDQLSNELLEHESAGPDYWLAHGTFADAQRMPSYLEFSAPNQLPPGKLVRKLERKDLGLVTEWTWVETLTDCVNISDHRAARNEVSELMVSTVMATCREVWGPDYQLQDLESFLRGDVTTCFQEVCDAILELGLRKEYTDARAQIRAAEVLKRHGLDWFNDEGQVIEAQSELNVRLRAFLLAQLPKYIRDKQGRLISSRQVEELLDKSNEIITSVESSPSSSSTEESRFSLALYRLLTAKLGGEEEAAEYSQRIGARLFGLYLVHLFSGETEFNYEMTVPGVVLETNAKIESDQKVRWRFNAKEAFPLGYEMHLFVAVPNQSVLNKHFPNSKLNLRESIVAYRNLVLKNSDLQSELRDLVTRDDPKAWKKWCRDNPRRTKLIGLNP